MGIRIEQIDIQSIAKVFITRVELDTRVIDVVKDYLANEERVVSVSSGEGLAVSGTKQDVIVSMKKATTEEIGGIRVGSKLSIDEEGILSANCTDYVEGEGIVVADHDDEHKSISLKRASSDGLGGIKIGSGLSMNASGVASVNINELPDATNKRKGLIKLGNGLSFNEETRCVDVQFKDDIDVSDVAMSIAGDNLTYNGVTGRIDAKAFKAGIGLTSNEEGNDVTLDVVKATRDTLGVVKPGENISITEDGRLDVEIPRATNANHGTIQLGENLKYNEDTHAVDVELTKASYSTLGVVKPSGKNITVDKNGVIDAVIGLDDIELIVDSIREINVKMHSMQLEIENITTILGQIDKDNVMKVYAKNFITGSNVFNGLDGLTVKLPEIVTNTDYTVILTPSISTNGSLGEFWIEDKTTESFRVGSSGSLVSAKFDWILMLSETDTTDFDKDKFALQHGNATLQPGEDGVEVTLTNEMKNDNYSVYISPVGNHEGEYGEVWTENKTTTGFTIKTSGGTSSDVNYIVVTNEKLDYNQDNLPVVNGKAKFEGEKLIEITLPVNLFKDRNYQVMIAPASDAEGYLGEYWVEEKTTNSFKVRTTGGTDVEFNYTVFGI